MGIFEESPERVDASGMRIAMVVARFNQHITGRLLEGAHATARERGVAEENLDTVWVPGAFELPQAARRLGETGRYDAVACLGCVIRGETPHFDFVCNEAARGISEAARDLRLPVVFGVITTDNVEQANARAGGAVGNKGHEAMLAAIEMAALYRRLDERTHADAPVSSR